VAKSGRTNRRQQRHRRVPFSRYAYCFNGHYGPYAKGHKLCSVRGCRGWRVRGVDDRLLGELRHDWHLLQIHHKFLQRLADKAGRPAHELVELQAA